MEIQMQFAQVRDCVETGANTNDPIDLSPFTGMWINSNSETSGIAKVLMSDNKGALSVRAYGIGPEGLIDWGTAEATVFTSGPSSRTCAGFSCLFDFGFGETLLQGLLAKGLLVLAQFHTFKDDSNRAAYFTREYYALEHGRY